MKKVKVVLFSATVMLILVLILFMSCTKNQEKISFESKFVLTEPNSFEGLFIFPVGTILSIKDNGLHFKLPEGVKMITRVIDNTKSGISFQILTLSEGTVTCKCTEGSGCNPYVVNGQSGCSTTNNSCTKCEMTITEDQEEQLLMLETVVINLSLETEFITNAIELKDIPSPSKLMFESKEVMEKLNAFLKGYDDGNPEVLKSINIDNTPANYQYVPAKFLGKLIIVPVNKNKSVSAYLLDPSLKSTKYTCSCTEGSGCTLGKTWTPSGTIHYCDAGECTTCSISTEDQEAPPLVQTDI